jgi:hypothetical protein
MQNVTFSLRAIGSLASTYARNTACTAFVVEYALHSDSYSVAVDFTDADDEDLDIDINEADMKALWDAGEALLRAVRAQSGPLEWDRVRVRFQNGEEPVVQVGRASDDGSDDDGSEEADAICQAFADRLPAGFKRGVLKVQYVATGDAIDVVHGARWSKETEGDMHDVTLELDAAILAGLVGDEDADGRPCTGFVLTVDPDDYELELTFDDDDDDA